MKVTVFGGAGQMGRVAVRALVDQGHSVVVADREMPRDAAALHLRTDASDPAQLRVALVDADAILNFIGPYYRYGTLIAEAAIEARLPYVDVCDDADVTLALLDLGDRARDTGTAVVTGAGGSPGVLNVMAVAATSGLETVDQLRTCWAIAPRAEGGPAVMAHTIHCVADPYPTWRNGDLETTRGVDGDSFTFPFPSPVGPVRVRDFGHPEPVTLSRVVAAKEIRTFGGIIPEAALEVLYALVQLGLGDTRSLHLNGRETSPRHFLAAFLQQQGADHEPAPDRERIGLGALAMGRSAGRDVERRVAFANRATLADSTALPAVAALLQVAEGVVPPGVHGPEGLEPARWLADLTDLHPTLFGEFTIHDEARDDDQVVTAADIGRLASAHGPS